MARAKCRRPPQPPTPWGTRNATWFAPNCVQDGWVWGILSGLSEDCLYLNVYVPNKAAPAGAPQCSPVSAFCVYDMYVWC